MNDAEKWAALVKWVEDTDGDEEADIWDFLGDELGVEPDGSKDTECDCGCLDDEDDEDEYDTLDMKVLGFKTTERLNGNWNSLLFEIRNYEEKIKKIVEKYAEKYCVLKIVEKYAENLNSYPKENVDRIIAMMKEDMGE